MATVLTCGVCRYPMTFKDIAPETMGEREKEVHCTRCGTGYAILIRMTNGPSVGEVDKIKNRPSA